MQIARIAAAVVTALVVVVLLVAAVLPSRYRVSRSANIRADASSLSARLADLSTREQWVPWKEAEPTASFVASGTPRAAGSTFSWSGRKIGAGTVILVRFEEARAVETRVEFRRPMRMVARDRFELQAQPSGLTTVTWTNEGDLSWPAGRLFGLVIDRVVGADYERGLATLKRISETASMASR